MSQHNTSQQIWTKSFISLFITQFILFTVFYSLLTTLPMFVIDVLGESKSSAGLVVTFMLISAILVRPFSAKILDIIGKKNTLVISVLAFTLTTFGYLWVESFGILLILRLIHGISFAIVTTATGAIAADIIPAARRGTGMGYFSMSMNLAVVTGPFIGLSLLQVISFKQLFLIFGILMVTSLIISLLVTLNELPAATASLTLKLADLVEVNALPVAIISGMVGVAYAGILSFVPVFAEEKGLSTTASYFFLIFAIVMIVSRPTLGRLFDEKGAKIVLVPSIIIFAIGLTVLGLTNNSLSLLIAAAIIGLGYGSLLPGFQTLAVQSTTNERSGYAVSTFFILYDTGIAIGAFIWGIVIAGASFSSMYFIGSAFMFFTAGVLYKYLSSARFLEASNK